MGYDLVQHRHVNLTAISSNHYPICIEIFNFSSFKFVIAIKTVKYNWYQKTDGFYNSGSFEPEF